ncbi:protein kinase domain-containing protein [Hyalangium rubrum]|uniref:Protein kinase n=1 Tax=Hyalangium rubrum TaxID=3103134 RepID=A0ABU5HJZ7_9BACT|nr:protein kinase [Hyalangium sp. s54d21]MDY7233234.1 protein kinase [Hyalangium sp. s54d21]
MDPTGQRIGAFEIVRLLGAGAMGMVYLAKDNILRRDVALKLLTKRNDEIDHELHERFLREARAAARLMHPNVVQIFQIGETARYRFIAMEYVEGASTRQVAKQHGGRLPEPFALEKMREAADALRLAGSMGICHRDIKPANLLLNAAKVLKITDFGLAAQMDGGGTLGQASAQIEGTPFYMSPEQWAGGNITPSSDIYSLGCTFFHLITGSRPFAANDFFGSMQAHIHSPVPDARSLLPELDASFAELLKRTMAKQPQERPTAVELIERLDEQLLRWRNLARPRSPQGPAVTTGGPASFSISEGSVPSFSSPSSFSPTSRTNWSGPTASSLMESSGREIELLGNQSYHQYYALKGYPFSDIRQPASFWEGGPYGSALSALAARVQVGQRVNVLVGPSGSGRTFLCEMLQHKLPGSAVFSIEPQLLLGSRLFLALCRQSGVHVNPTSSQRFLIEAFLAQVTPPDRPDAPVVIVVDGVDPNDRELLEDIDRIAQAAPRRKFSLVLVGTESLPEGLVFQGAPPSLLAGIPPVSLRPMTQQEMVDYIEFRMRSVGGFGWVSLDAASRQLLYLRSGGLPRLVSIYCHNALTLAMIRQEKLPRLDTLRLAMKSKLYLTPEGARSLLATG